MTSDQDAPAPGWDAITNVFASLYPGIEPKHVGYQPGLAFGSGLQGCSAYRALDHWHYVTYGLTELWEKDVDSEPSVSGWGYEFTMRVPPQDDDMPPRWPFVLLEQLARPAISMAPSTRWAIASTFVNQSPANPILRLQHWP